MWLAGAITSTLLAEGATPTGGDAVIYPKAPGASGAAMESTPGASVTVVFLGLALGLVGLWLLWRAKRDSKLSAQRGQLSISETRSLGSKQYLVVASYGSRKFLLGVCPGKIEMLTPLDDRGGETK